MQVLTKPTQIRAAIRDVLGDSTRGRVVIVAFVGQDALSYLPEPKGLELYCWAKAGGTNPNEVEKLRAKPNLVDVHFVPKLHIKLYWSEKRGAIVGSANLTNNALGDEGLHELVVRVPSKSVDIGALLRILKKTEIKDVDARLSALFLEHDRYYQQHGGRGGKSKRPLRTYREWRELGPAAPDWRLGWYEHEIENAPKDALKSLEATTGTSDHRDFMGASKKGHYKEGLFTLSCKISRKKGGKVAATSLHWWLPEICVYTGQRSWSDYPFLWFAQKKISPEQIPPFNVKDSTFRSALGKALTDLGGLKYLESSAPRPTKKLLAAIDEHFPLATR